jgi:hypothetical protein
MKPVLGILAMFALLLGTAFAQIHGGFGSMDIIGGIIFLIMIWAVIVIAFIFFIALLFWRNKKEGSIKKRFSDFTILFLTFNGILAMFFIILVAITNIFHIYFYMGGQGWGSLIIMLILFSISSPISVYICRKYYPKISSWNYLILPFLSSLISALITFYYCGGYVFFIGKLKLL